MPTWLMILLAILGALAGFGGLAGGVYAARQSYKANRENRKQQQEEKAESWNSGYRAAAERHLPWDIKILELLSEAQQEINHLRLQLHLDPHEFAAIPEKPPLFPEFSK